MKQLRLFAVANAKGNVVRGADNKPAYYADKQAAKRVRDALNEDGGEFHVTRGPDHIGPHSSRKKGWRNRK